MKFEDAPRPLRQAALGLVALKNRRGRYGLEYRTFSRLLRETARWAPEQQYEWQADELQRLVHLAVRSTDHYKNTYGAVPEASQGGAPFPLLQRFPVLEKSVLRAQDERLVNHSVREFVASHTSGSTGSPMRIGHDRIGVQRRFALLADHRRMAGADPAAPSVRLSGRILCKVSKTHARPWLYNPFERQLFVSTYHLDPHHAPAIADRIAVLRPEIIDGYPSAVLALLRLLSGHGTATAGLKAVICTAETLQEDVRAEIGSLGEVPVLDYYSASEGLPFIQQCPAGRYHVRWQSGILEVERAGTLSDSGDGDLVCTSFVQFRTPLIRYRTGDLVEGLRPAGEVACPCGLLTPTIEHVLGRVEDLIRTRDGRQLGMFTYRTLKTVTGLREAQIVQNDVDRFTVRYVLDPGARAEEVSTLVRTNIERALGYEVDVKFDEVTELPRGRNNKLRLVISEMDGA